MPGLEHGKGNCAQVTFPNIHPLLLSHTDGVNMWQRKLPFERCAREASFLIQTLRSQTLYPLGLTLSLSLFQNADFKEALVDKLGLK